MFLCVFANSECKRHCVASEGLSIAGCPESARIQLLRLFRCPIPSGTWQTATYAFQNMWMRPFSNVPQRWHGKIMDFWIGGKLMYARMCNRSGREWKIYFISLSQEDSDRKGLELRTWAEVANIFCLRLPAANPLVWMPNSDVIDSEKQMSGTCRLAMTCM